MLRSTGWEGACWCQTTLVSILVPLLTECVILGKPLSISVPHSLVSKVGTAVLRAEAVVRYKVLRKGPMSRAQQMLVINSHLVNTKEFLTAAFRKAIRLSLLIYLLFGYYVSLFSFTYSLYLLKKSERQISRTQKMGGNIFLWGREAFSYVFSFLKKKLLPMYSWHTVLHYFRLFLFIFENKRYSFQVELEIPYQIRCV